MKQRLDQALTKRGITDTRSQAENWIRLGKVTVNGRVVQKAGFFVNESDDLTLTASERYVSRAGLKLASVAGKFLIDFTDKIVLDVGSSTGGFTDYAIQHGAKKVYAVDVGTDQLHPSLRKNPRIELHEKTDIRDFTPSAIPDIIVIDVSFISLRSILPHIMGLSSPDTQVIAMVKPQFETSRSQIGSDGVIKNDTMRRNILRDFEQWSRQYAVTRLKADSMIKGAKGNQERFYLLNKVVK